MKHKLGQNYRKIKYSHKWQSNRFLSLLHPLFILATKILIFFYQKIYLPVKRSRPGRILRTWRANFIKQFSSHGLNSNLLKLASLFAKFGNWQAAKRTYELIIKREQKSREPKPENVNDAKFNISVINRLTKLKDYQASINNHGKSLKAPRIALYTAISGGYDTVKLPEVLLDNVDYFLFTDTPARGSGIFKILPMPYFHVDTTRMARYVKTHPHQLFEGYDMAIWVDANILIAGDISGIISDFVKSKKAVGAIPHPLRNTLYQEAEACIARSKEDAALIKEQIRHYQALNYETKELIESNIMLFDLKDKNTAGFFATWWSEIDKFTRRDQLSLNYSLDKNNISWHPIMEKAQDARNHPLFVLVPHHARQRSVAALELALGSTPTDPYQGIPFEKIKRKIIKSQVSRKIDIVYCVHNALEDVRLCLESVARHRKNPNLNLVIVDDGSEKPTADFLRDFQSKNKQWVKILRNNSGSGYTKAANQGLRATTGEMVILLNSDTIVTDGWTEKMAEAVFSTPGAGIVGPLSSAASHQSIPNHIGGGNQTATNELPSGLTPEDINKNCEKWSLAGYYPHVPLVHGFCFGITREAIDKIGGFDEKSFPNGYGEENDYCFRAVDEGFCLVLATNTYIYHAKSKSYQDDKRIRYMKAGNEKLRQLRGEKRIARSVKSVLANPYLQKFRDNTYRLYNTFNK